MAGLVRGAQRLRCDPDLRARRRGPGGEPEQVRWLGDHAALSHLSIVFAGMGLDHPLLNYAEVTVPLSDMNGDNYGGAVGWWLRWYWTAFALIWS